MSSSSREKVVKVSDGIRFMITPEGIRVEVTEYHPENVFVSWEQLVRWQLETARAEETP